MPEVGTWCTVGGLGVMVHSLSQALVERGLPVLVIAPAYNSCAAQWQGASVVGRVCGLDFHQQARTTITCRRFSLLAAKVAPPLLSTHLATMPAHAT